VLARLDELLVDGETDRWVVITGGPGMGKSALLAAWLARRVAAGAVVPHHFIRRRMYDWDDPGQLVGSLVAQIEDSCPTLGEPEGDERLHPATRLSRALARVSERALRPHGARLVVVIDGLDEYDPPASLTGDPLAAFLPDASASHDQTLKVWDLESGAGPLTHHGDAAYSAIVATSASAVVAGDAAGTLWFLDVPMELSLDGGTDDRRQVRARTERPASRPNMKKQTILFLAANPTGTSPLALGEEARAIHAELKRSGHRDCFDLQTRWAAQPLDLLRELRELKPAVVHFSGHGGGRPADAAVTGTAPHRDPTSDMEPSGDPSPRGLAFQAPGGGAQVVTAEALRDTFGAVGAPVRLVVLSACYSDLQVEALLAHVDAVVGMRGPIGDDAARNFAIGFYGGLGERESVAAAFRQGCAAIRLEGLRDSDRPVLRVRDGVDANTLILGFVPFDDASTSEHAGAPAEPDRRASPVIQIHHLEVHGGTGIQLHDGRLPTSGGNMHPGPTPPSHAPSGAPAPQADIAIITIRDDEFRAVLDVFPSQAGRLKGAHREYNLRHADAGNGGRYTVAVLRQVEQGTGEAQNVARDLVEDLGPRLVIVVGIAGGLPSNDVKLGDVVLSTRIHDFTLEARTFGEPTQYAVAGGPIPKALQDTLANLAAREGELGDWAADLPPQPAVTWTRKGQLYGPATWQRELKEKLTRHHGKRSSPRAPRYVDGPISDIVGLKRSEAWTVFACASAAAFTRAFLRTRPVPVGALPVAVHPS
jgi:hypothetical protein